LPVRLNGAYVRPTNPLFELAFLRVFRIWLFKTHFSDVQHVYEFGCGTGFNLVELAQLFPLKEYWGLDFVSASAELVTKIGQAFGWNMKGRLFDFKNPDAAFKLEEDCGVFTIGAIEQVAGDFHQFLQYLLEQRVKVCVNVEPTIELYDEEKLFDYLAVRFHKKRGYSMNYLSTLKELEAQGKIRLWKVKRLNFGSQLMEGYSYMVWSPLQGS
jgi:SAM-dependent methyltransferase